MHLHPHLHQMHRVALLALALCALAHTELVGAVVDGLGDYLHVEPPPAPKPLVRPADELRFPPRGTRVPGTYYFWELMDARYPMGDA